MPANKREDFSVNTIIGPNTHINGDVNSAGFTRIDGSLCGDLNATGRIIVGERARMRSNITGTAVTIGGVVSGNVLASERVTILATGIVLGDIITQRIQADEGCLLHGRITVCQTREKWNSAVNEYRDIEHLRSVTAGFALPNPPASGVSATEPVPENDIQAVETIPPAVEPETIDPAPAAENETPAFEYAALPREMPFIGEQAAPESPAEEFPPADTAPENAPVTADGAVFTENTPDPPEEAAFTGNTPLLSQNNAAVPAIPFPGTVDTGGNHGES